MTIKKIIQNLIITFGMLILSQIGPNLVVLAITAGWVNRKAVFPTLLLTIFIIGNIAIVVWWAKKLNLLEFNWNFLTKKNIALIFGVFIVSRVVIMIYTAFQLIITGAGTNNDQQIISSFQHAPASLIFLTLAVAAPIMEEIVFRGCIIRLIFHAHPKTGLLISSLLFGAAHTIGDWISFPVYFIMGLALGFIYLKTDRLETSISVHFLNNLIGTLAIIYGIA